MEQKAGLTNFSVLEMVYARVKDFFGAKVVESDQTLKAMFDAEDDDGQLYDVYMNYEEVSYLYLDNNIYFMGLGRRDLGCDKVAARRMDLLFTSMKRMMYSFPYSRVEEIQNKDLSKMSIKDFFEFIVSGPPMFSYPYNLVLIAAMEDEGFFCILPSTTFRYTMDLCEEKIPSKYAITQRSKNNDQQFYIVGGNKEIFIGKEVLYDEAFVGYITEAVIEHIQRYRETL